VHHPGCQSLQMVAGLPFCLSFSTKLAKSAPVGRNVLASLTRPSGSSLTCSRTYQWFSIRNTMDSSTIASSAASSTPATAQSTIPTAASTSSSSSNSEKASDIFGLDPGTLVFEAPPPEDGIDPNAGKPKFYLICYNVSKRMNVGNIMRSACAFGVAEILVVGAKTNKVQYFGAQGERAQGPARHSEWKCFFYIPIVELYRPAIVWLVEQLCLPIHVTA
jgi:hypothetical protein